MRGIRFEPLRSVLCVGAHPDDLEIGCGGTLLTLLERNPGLEVTWVVLSGDPVRRAEATRSAEELLEHARHKTVVLENFRDAYFPYEGAKIKDFFHELGDSVDPDLIFTHRREDAHQDHRLVSELTWNAFRDHAILEYEIPKYEGDLGAPNVFQPLSEKTAQRKVRTIVENYESQKSKQWFSEDTFWSLLRIRGIECNAGSRFAEGFTARKLVL